MPGGHVIRYAAGAILIIAVAAFFLTRSGASGAAADGSYETVAADRGTVARSVATSGAVRPLVTVQVGSELSGQVLEVLVDYNSEVSAGDLIAKIDPQTFDSRVEAARADRAVAAANLQVSRASLARAEALLRQRSADFARLSDLGVEGGVAEIELDAARAQAEVARADVDAARAQVSNAEAVAQQRDAALRQAEVDLQRTEIRSPINGVVILKSVDVGQTVAASFQAPILFEIAQDLSQIQIEADVNEADIGAVQPGNRVTFTVDAYPERTFEGAVETVRLAPNELANVVTYTVIITAENPGKILFPGMTATVEIVTGRSEDALRAPNAALRFRPEGVELPGRGGGQGGGGRGGRGGFGAAFADLGLSDEQQTELQNRIRGVFAGGGGGDPEQRRARIEAILRSVMTEDQFAQYQEARANAGRAGLVWVENARGEPEPRRVRIGLTDATHTEIIGGELEEGDAVIVRENRQAS